MRTTAPEPNPSVPAATDRTAPATPVVTPGRAAYPLSLALAAAVIASALPTVLVDDVLHGPAVMAGSARGTALVMLVVGVPMLLAALAAVRRGSARGLLVWLGAVGYLLYNAIMLLFGTPFNVVFLGYVATLALAMWSAGTLLWAVDMPALGRRITPGVPRRFLACYVWAVVGINALLWLRGVIPGLSAAAAPAFLVGTGLTTSPTYVQDLAGWLPLMAVAAVWLWRGLTWGYLVVGSVLTMWVVESLTIAVDQWFGHLADPGSAVASGSMVPVFAALAVVGLVPAGLMLVHLGPPAPAPALPTPATTPAPGPAPSAAPSTRCG